MHINTKRRKFPLFIYNSLFQLVKLKKGTTSKKCLEINKNLQDPRQSLGTASTLEKTKSSKMPSQLSQREEKCEYPINI